MNRGTLASCSLFTGQNVKYAKMELKVLAKAQYMFLKQIESGLFTDLDQQIILLPCIQQHELNVTYAFLIKHWRQAIEIIFLISGIGIEVSFESFSSRLLK